MMRALLLVLCLALPQWAFARALIVDLSPRVVEITHDFVGLDVLLYGAQNDPGTIAVVLRGEPHQMVVRKKARIAGLWVNTDSVTFNAIPSLYSTAFSEPLTQVRNDDLLRQLGVGLEFLSLPTDSSMPEEQVGEFREALVRNLQRQGLYNTEPLKLSFWGETLFRTFLHFPKNLNAGWYTADVYLFNDGLLNHVQSFPIHVRKIGFEAFVYRMAHEHELLYGIGSVGMAVLAGWLATRIFRRAA